MNWKNTANINIESYKKKEINSNILDLKKTEYLKTAIIENEWINKFNKDILDGP